MKYTLNIELDGATETQTIEAADTSLPAQLVAEGKTYIRSSEHKFELVRPDQPAKRAQQLGTVVALTEYLRRHGKPETSLVVVSPTKGCYARLDERALEHMVEDCCVPLFADDMTPDGWFGHFQLLEWLDMHEGMFEDEAPLRAALRTVKASGGSGVTITRKGGVIALDVRGTSGVSTNAQIPEFLRYKARWLTREYQGTFRVRVEVLANDKHTNWRLTVVEPDGVRNLIVQQALSDLRKALGEGWLVVEGA